MAIWQLIGFQFAYAWIASSITKNKRSSVYPPGGEWKKIWEQGRKRC